MNITTSISSFSPYGQYSLGQGNIRVSDQGNGPSSIPAPYPVGQRQEVTGPDAGAGAVSTTQAPERSQGQDQQNSGGQTRGTAADAQLTPQELQLVEELKKTDQEVRQHEMAHVAAGGSLVTTGAQFTYRTGPDGKQYAVAGEVGIDTSAVPGDPQATIQKMQQVKRAALAPASPSSQDLKVASQASSKAAEAAGELTALIAKQQAAGNEAQAYGPSNRAADAYAQVGALPEEDTHTFRLAV